MAARKSKSRKVASKKSDSGRGVGKRYSDTERKNILATAKRESLTGAQVKQRFGVTPVTYYSWRKKSGAGTGQSSGRAVATGAAVGRAVAGAMNIADAIREELRSHIRKILPDVLANELGSAPRRGGSRRSR